MDPEQALENLRNMVAEILRNENADEVAVELAEQFKALDEWIINGGFLPAVWRDP